MKTEKIEYINSRSWHKVIKGRIINIPARISKYYSRKNQYSLLRNALPEFAHGNIISIGYGGEISKVLDGENIKYTSIDITGSPDVLCDVQDMRVFKEESVDTIICMSVLAEVENPIKAVSEFKRILKPNGFIICSTAFILPQYQEQDLYRFTKSGVRYLFRDFKEIQLNERSTYLESALVILLRTVNIGTRNEKIAGIVLLPFYLLLAMLTVIGNVIIRNKTSTTAYFSIWEK